MEIFLEVIAKDTLCECCRKPPMEALTARRAYSYLPFTNQHTESLFEHSIISFLPSTMKASGMPQWHNKVMHWPVVKELQSQLKEVGARKPSTRGLRRTFLTVEQESQHK